MSAGKDSTKTYQKYDFLKNVRPNLSLVVLIEVVLKKKRVSQDSINNLLIEQVLKL